MNAVIENIALCLATIIGIGAVAAGVIVIAAFVEGDEHE